jgi:outer membrane protein TolC
MTTRYISGRACALTALVALGGCVLAPRGTRDERQRLEAAGRAWSAPPAERALPELPAEPGWRDLLERAFLANGELEAAYHDWRAAMARIDVAATWPDTNVSLGFEYLFSGGNLKAWDRTTLTVGFDPMQNLSFPTKTLAAGRAAFDEARAAGARFAAVKFDLQRRVLVAWLEYALLAEKVRLQREDATLAGLLADTAASRVRAGAADTAVAEAEVQRALAANELGRMEAELVERRATLNALLARPPGAPLAAPATLPPPRPLPADDARLLAVATASNPELAALAHEVAGREDALAFARQQWIPDFNPFAGFEGSMAQIAGVAISLPTRVPVIRGAVREARAMLARAEATARQTGMERGASFVAALAALRDAERQTALLDAQVLPAATRGVAGARALYTGGALDLAGLVAAERALLDLRALAAEARVARDTRLAELEALAGVDVETLGRPS